MKIEFEHEYLRELYEQGKASGKKYRFQPQVIKQYKKPLTVITICSIIELSSHYEK